MASTKPPSGTRDFLPEDIRRREYVIGTIRRVYERYGFEPLETPAFENIETLLGKYGEEGDKLIFKILKRGEQEGTGQADLALRYDLTVPLARVVAEYRSKLPGLFKRYQIQPVWRADRPQKGRFREFFQCDIDSIGSTSPVVEVEQLSAVAEVLSALGFTDFTIQLNHRALLNAMLESAAVPVDHRGDALVAIDKLDKIGPDKVAQEFYAHNIPMAATSACLAAVESVPAFDALIAKNEHGVAAKREVEQILSLIAETPAAKHVSFVPRLARGLSYYTGAIMEISVPDLAGSLGGGGRYDNLIGMFSNQSVPACGFSLGLERILVVMSERNMFPSSLPSGAVDVVVTFMDAESQAESLKLASEIREGGFRAEVYPEISRKFDKVLKAASGRGAKLMAVFGENERTQKQVSVRDLIKREALQPLPRDSAAVEIARLLRREP